MYHYAIMPVRMCGAGPGAVPTPYMADPSGYLPLLDISDSGCFNYLDAVVDWSYRRVVIVYYSAKHYYCRLVYKSLCPLVEKETRGTNDNKFNKR